MLLLFLFTLWSLYLGIGFGWLIYATQKKYLKEHNTLGCLIIISIWPLHLIYTKYEIFKKFIKTLF